VKITLEGIEKKIEIVQIKLAELNYELENLEFERRLLENF